MQFAPPSFNAVDWTVVVLLLLGLISGFRRGLSGELATVAATVISGIAAWKLSGWAQGLLLQNLDLTPREATMGGVIAVFAIVYLVLWIVRRTLRAMMDYNFKGKAERMGGALCGLIRFFILALIGLLIATFIPNPDVQQAVARDSFFGRFVDNRVRPLADDLAKKHGVEIPSEGVPPANDLPPIRDDAETAPPGVITNEVPAELPLGPVR